MLWLWTWTALSLAGPAALPPGVTASPVAREMAHKPRGAEVTFALDGRPELKDGRLVVRGVLANGGSRAAVVYVAETTTGGPFVLSPRGATPRPLAAPAPPPPPPWPVELVLPPGARVPYESEIVLEAWELPPGGAEIDWTFQFWTSPVKGTLEGRLQPAK